MTAADDVLRSPGYLLMKAGHHIGLELEAALAEIGLSGRELLLLSFVRAHPDLSQQELSGRLGLDPTIVVGLVDALEQRGLLRRAKDPADRRRNVLSATDDGIGVHDAAIAAARRAEDVFLAPLDERQRAELATALRTMLAPRLSWL
jgi:DNA-binding MarR family transcriptional regulator